MPRFNDPSRRRFLATSAGAVLGAGFATGSGEPTGKTKSLIHLFMDGGMSHLDTFDPKPGITPAIPTKVAGVSISSGLPRLAERMDKITLFRSMSHAARSHGTARMNAHAFPGGFSFVSPSQVEAKHFAKAAVEARCLVEGGARFVRITLGGWDAHTNCARNTAAQAAILDEVIAGLLDDLSSRGMLADTLIALSTEFGRSACLNGFGGREHHPGAYCCLLAGGGIKGGRVIGCTTDDGMEVIGESISPEDFNAIIASHLGSRHPANPPA